jgi:predicted alpha-1,2-mannosidase
MHYNFSRNLIVAFSVIAIILTGCSLKTTNEKDPVDYVNPYLGNISHLLLPTYPTVHLPNSLLRVRPLRDDFTGDVLQGLPTCFHAHRGGNAFRIDLIPAGNSYPQYNTVYQYDNEVIKPYLYEVYLNDLEADLRFVPSHQSAIYEMNFGKTRVPAVMLSAFNGKLTVSGRAVSGYKQLKNSNTKIYLYLETEQAPLETAVFNNDIQNNINNTVEGCNVAVLLKYKDNNRQLHIRYGVSLISEEQARKNLHREQKGYDLDALAEKGRNAWNEALGKIQVTGEEEDKKVFYTSLYRFYERLINTSEDNQYYSPFDAQIHENEGISFYNDDWIWDTYRAAHPLRTIISPQVQRQVLHSFIRMAEQSENFWMPNFPEVHGDTRRMNANHGVAVFLDSYEKGITDIDLNKAYLAGKNAVTEKTLAPWSAQKAGRLDVFYKKNGYFPALQTEEKETAPEVDAWEKRQPVAVTLGTVYDEWCLAQLAKHLDIKDDSEYFLKRSLNYHKLFNPKTKFFHPKDENGNFIEPFDYEISGELGARNAYDENNGWIYRWDVQHNIKNLVEMMGGNEAFIQELERMYNTPLSMPKYEFYAMLPDHTGNVGQFSMGNEPSLHIPYLYNYAQEPWRTQKRIRNLLVQWFGNTLMGMPGDEDGGGMSSFVVFSQLGFYPVTPGLPMYVIGSPVFEYAVINLEDGNTFEIKCHNYAVENKYIQSAKLNGKSWNKSWFSHDDLKNGGVLEFTMGKYPNKQWASTSDAIPPSFEMKK